MVDDKETGLVFTESPSRRSFLGMSSVAVATVTFPGLTADAQDKASTQKAEHDHSSSEPGSENRPLSLVLFAAPQVLLAFSLSQWIRHL